MSFYYEYVSISDRKKWAKKQIEDLKSKNKILNPVIIEGNKIAKTWWGIAWNKNLESYADYSNRLGRGRSYLKNGFVIDLIINEGVITSLVGGSYLEPYEIEIKIAPVKKNTMDRLSSIFNDSINNLEDLINGEFPKDMQNLFTQKGDGLFPTPRELDFNCSCPDSAYMCKHIAATLYAVGAKLDEDPTLFFRLRNISFENFLKRSIEEKMQNMLDNADKKSNRVLENIDLDCLFGIEI